MTVLRRMWTALRVLAGAGGLVCEDCGALRQYSSESSEYAWCCQRCNDCNNLRSSPACRHWNADGSEATQRTRLRNYFEGYRKRPFA